MNTEYEFYVCKNNCKRNQNIKSEGVKKIKSTCDLCLECPLCFSGLVKRCYNNTFMYACPYCYWDTSNIKFAKAKETDLDILIGQLQERSCSGFLKRMYTHALNKLKKQENIFAEEKSGQRGTIRPSLAGDISDMVKKAMDTGTWSKTKLEESLEKEKEDNEKKNGCIEYDDNYINDTTSSYFDFTFISTLLGCSLEYLDNNFSKIESADVLKDKMKNLLDIRSISTLEQRLAHVIFQNPISSIQFPKFFDVIPKKAKSSRSCKNCRKILASTEETSMRSGGMKLEIQHFYITQFPTVSIYKIDLNLKILMLKFTLINFNEIGLSFREDPDSSTKVTIPPDRYEISTKNDAEPNDFLFKSTDKFIILNFRFKEEYLPNLDKEGSTHILRFFIKAEYNRGGSNTTETIEYGNEVKFTVHLDNN